MRKLILLLTLLMTTASLFAADAVPLSTSIKFDPQPKLRSEPITLVFSSELSHLSIQKKMRLMRLEFPLGKCRRDEHRDRAAQRVSESEARPDAR
jgi:hypothetical protein